MRFVKINIMKSMPSRSVLREPLIVCVSDLSPCPLQKGLMEVLYEIFRIPLPIVTQDFTEALLSVGE